MPPPTQNQVSSLTQQLDEDDIEELEKYKESASECILYMLPYILPTDQRLKLIEWLLQQIEPTIFENSDFMTSDTEKVTNLEIACRQYGIRQQGKRPLGNSIKGVNGITEAINFLWELVDFVKQLILFENLKNPHQKMMNNNKLVNYITQNCSQIFCENVRLFSPGFPKCEESEHEPESKIKDTHDQIQSHVSQCKEEFTKMQSEFDTQLAQNTSKESFDQLESSLKQARDQVITFKQEYESGYISRLNNIQDSNQPPIEDLVRSVHSHRLKTGKVSDDLTQILSTLNELKN